MAKRLGALSDEEFTDWAPRMFEAVGVHTSPGRSGESHAMFIGNGPAPQHAASSPPELVRELSCSVELSSAAGRVRVARIGLYDSAVRLDWESLVETDLAVLFADALRALERDLAGLPSGDAEEIRAFSHLRLRSNRLYSMTLTDNESTIYVQSGKSLATSGGGHIGGWVQFSPGPPSESAELIVSWHDATARLPNI
jgi:hypothetical protein